jgi:transcriptional regulator with XRE-family HTH domain
MSKKLNITAVKDAMDRKGISPARLARDLDVSREAVSKWLKGAAVPRPDKLLKLALGLGLRLGDVVIRPENETEPVVAFRKMGARKTTEKHIAHAKEIGRLLRPLVKYLPFDELLRPPTLKKPRCDYAYVQEVAMKIREETGLRTDEPVDFRHLIKKFTELQAVLIPVLWGRKDRHENALHIFLPDSMTTWVYLNLDSEVHDFKFWMAHELGHILAPELKDAGGEDFADAFAGALLLPQEQVAEAFKYVHSASKNGVRVNRIKEIAERNLISPISVYYEINKYAKYLGLEKLDLGNAIFGAAKNLSKDYYTVSESLFDNQTPTADKYIKIAEELFESPFFAALREYLRTESKGPGYIQSILDIPLLDSREIYRELV